MGRVHEPIAVLRSDSSKSLYSSSMHEVIMESHSESIATLGSELQHHHHQHHHDQQRQMLSQSQRPPHRGSPVRIRIQRLQLLLVTITLVALVAVLMWLCVDPGVRFETFVSTDKDDSARKRLLNKYNSFSGNFVSVLTKPLELFATLTIALALLCFATNFTLGRSTTRYHHVLLIAAAVAGYLLTNGFNAVNVQLAPRPIQPVVSAQDLSQSAATDAVSLSRFIGAASSQLATRMSNRSLLEETTKNPITNTAFRNWVLSAELSPAPQCHWKRLNYGTTPRWDGVLPFYGFPQRMWQSAALGNAAEPAKALKFVAENPAAAIARVLSSRGVDAAKMELPMSVNRAMYLLVHAVYMSEQIVFSEWGKFVSDVQVVAADMKGRRYAAGQYDVAAGNPTLVDFLLKDKSLNLQSNPVSDQDAVQVMANLTLRTFGVRNSTKAKVDVELTHFNLSDRITFDAITLDFPAHSSFLQRRLVVNTSAKSGLSTLNESGASLLSDDDDRYYDLNALTECSLSACALDDTAEMAATRPQVIGMRVCVNDKLQESLLVMFEHEDASVFCKSTSNSSMYTVSIGKRIEGEEIFYDTILDKGNATGAIVRLKNARKVYSITVGQLTWETQDLAALYGAECAGDDNSMCEGIRYELSATSGKQQQHVVVGSKRIPMDALAEFTYYAPWKARRAMLSLLKLTSAADLDSVFMTKEDLVLPRRFNKSSLPRSSDVNSTTCSRDVEDFAFHMEMNHLYIEKSLQPAYTAAVFFLFQDGVVRDVIDTGTGTAAGNALSAVTLAFLNNKQLVDVRLSSPLLNIVFTLVGAAILLTIAVAIALSGKDCEEKLERLADAHNVAEMLIDFAKYPSLLLEKTIVSGGENNTRRGNRQERKEEAPHLETARKPLGENVRIRHVVLGDEGGGVEADRDGVNQLAVNQLAQARDWHQISVL